MAPTAPRRPSPNTESKTRARCAAERGATQVGDTPRTVMIKRVLQDLRNHIATERARILSERTEELVDQPHDKIESGPEGAVKLTEASS